MQVAYGDKSNNQQEKKTSASENLNCKTRIIFWNTVLSNQRYVTWNKAVIYSIASSPIIIDLICERAQEKKGEHISDYTNFKSSHTAEIKCIHRKSVNKLLGLCLLSSRMLKHSLSLRAPSRKEKKDLSLPNWSAKTTFLWLRTRPSVETELWRYKLHTTRQENLSHRLLAAHRRQKTIQYAYLFWLSENKKQAKSIHGRNSNTLGKKSALRVDLRKMHLVLLMLFRHIVSTQKRNKISSLWERISATSLLPFINYFPKHLLTSIFWSEGRRRKITCLFLMGTPVLS